MVVGERQCVCVGGGRVCGVRACCSPNLSCPLHFMSSTATAGVLHDATGGVAAAARPRATAAG